MVKSSWTQAAVVCSKGCVRGNNEDNFFFNGDYMQMDEMDSGAHIVDAFVPKTQLFAVCDGMGGEDRGERASFLAVESMRGLVARLRSGDVGQTLREYAYKTTALIYKDGANNPSSRQGSTLAAAVLKNDMLISGNVGDSRVYLARGKAIKQLSLDHTEVNRMCVAGLLTPEEARKHPKSNVITQYLGMPEDELPSTYISMFSMRLCRYDRVMICSDGVSDLLTTEQIRQCLCGKTTPDEAAKKLVLLALELGGKDNATCIVVDMVGEALPLAKQIQDDLDMNVEDVSTVNSLHVE